ncbi:MAG TPA: glycosyltransferase family 39 protein, partial [Thermoanaerobaculia bacterium]|nr:glycosyltransferase family 39 protein [Thermoanaerobaculia bacterium]
MFLVLAGAALLALGRPPVHQALLQFLYPSPGWPKRAGVLEMVFTVYGFVLLALAGASLLASAKGQGLAARLRADRKTPASSTRAERRSREPILWLALALAIGAAASAGFLAQPMRFDESLAYLNFSLAPGYRVFNYSLTTNHVFHSVLAKASTGVLGSHPAAIRAPACLAGIASLLALFLFARELLGWEGGVFAAAGACAYPYLVLFATNARGYSLVVLFTLGLGFLGARFARS